MAQFSHRRTYKRFPFHAPLIIGGESHICEGMLRNLSMDGCSIVCDRELALDSEVRVNLLLPDQTSSLPIELGRITWVQGRECGVKFIRLPLHARLRLNRTLRVALIQFLNARRSQELQERTVSGL
ncbi:MAG: PilZ domain-containing protein [Nitrospirota bacterium]